MTEMNIKQMADNLQKEIDIRMEKFMHNHQQVKIIAHDMEQLEKNMFSIAMELEPVQSLIYTQHPELERIFESLKRIYGEE